MSTPVQKIVDSRHALTYEDYLTFPDDGMRYEIIEGELFMTLAPITKHQRVSLRLEMILQAYIRENKVGEMFHAPCDVIFSKTNVVQPDILFIANARNHIITEKNIQGAPDLIIEITSPNTEETDRGEKKRLYERYGVKEYWIVDPQKEGVEVWSLRAKKFHLYGHYTRNEVVSSTLLNGLKVILTELFGE